MKYKIKNISGYIALLGLFPGRSKTVAHVNSEMNKLKALGLLDITEVIETKPTVTVINEDIKKDEASK